MKNALVLVSFVSMFLSTSLFAQFGGRNVLRFQEVAQIQVSKLVEDSQFILVRSHYVEAIRVRAEKNSIDIVELQVRYLNGEVESIFELEGSLFRNEERTHLLRSFSRSVESIKVTATSGLLGSRGRLHVEIGSRF